MPELPEVETVCRGIRPTLQHEIFQHIIIREPRLRWPIPQSIIKKLPGLTINGITRRAKYLLLTTDTGTLLIHLGMSGCLRLHAKLPPAKKHDHVDFIFQDTALRYTDPRRFGAILWTEHDPSEHSLLKNLGPEPLSASFNATYLFKKSRHKTVAIKIFIMNSQIVAGVGNIYATEALFYAKIHPKKKTGDISKTEAENLTHSIKFILQKAIKAGGTTLKDFSSSSGKSGYFSQQLLAYGCNGKPCLNCNTLLEKIIIAQRATVYCPKCQK